VTHEGIRLDLEWMQRIGLGGALLFDIGFRSPPVPQYVERRIGFGTPDWEKAVRFAAAEARRLGLKFGAQSSGGWSVSGGSTVPPERAMKKLVWSETMLTSATPHSLRLPAPPSVNGPFQDVPVAEQFREPSRYDDVAVIAYRLPEVEQTAAPRPALTGATESSLLEDRSYSQATELMPDVNGKAVLSARFGAGNLPRAVTLAVLGPLPAGAIEASTDGIHFDTVVELPGHVPQPAPVSTFALGERNERWWRIRFSGLKAPLALTEARFEYGSHVNRAGEKAGYGVLADYAMGSTSAPARTTIDLRNVRDLTARMAPDGTLSWRPREGKWMVVRFGWSLTGRRSVPATPESIGLEVDKLDAAAVRAFAEDFYERYAHAIGDAGRLDIALTDSWEAGQQNWTPGMFREFAARRGYDMRPWMPALTGRVVGDVARSERFLADYRRTIADMLADHHYGVLAQVARARGMSLYSEAAGTDLPTVIDGIQAKGRVDVPMGEYWFYAEGAAPKANHVADVREAASAAHLYGRPIVAAEAFTTMGEEPWATGPAQLRRIADRFFAEGVNRIVLHTSAHQPFIDRRPGITLRQYGQHFTRNETWAEDAGAWVRYLARTSYLLQQGHPVADIAIFLGEDAAVSPPFHAAGEPRRLRGYDHDFVNAEGLLTRMSVRDGRLVLPDGVSYRALVIPQGVRRMSLPVIRKLRALVAGGAIVIGPKPLGAAGLADTDARVTAVADEVWGQPVAAVHTLGRGRVYSELSIEGALAAEQVHPDVAVGGTQELHWAHRAGEGFDIYFLSNQSAGSFDDTVRFRVHGKPAEQWQAVDGMRSPVNHSIGEQTTAVRVELAPYASRFIVFRGRAPQGTFADVPQNPSLLASLDGSWEVDFLDGPGTPSRTRLPAGSSWTNSADPAIRYYSGRARYSRTITISEQWLAANRRIDLDLGAVGEMAHVRVNDRDFGVWWNEPFRGDITDALRGGDNRLEIVVTNYWANRIIGDEQPGAARHTFTPIRPYTADSPLRPSGLLGPVRLLGTVSSTKDSP
jgi:hypothetical protein